MQVILSKLARLQALFKLQVPGPVAARAARPLAN